MTGRQYLDRFFSEIFVYFFINDYMMLYFSLYFSCDFLPEFFYGQPFSLAVIRNHSKVHRLHTAVSDLTKFHFFIK